MHGSPIHRIPFGFIKTGNRSLTPISIFHHPGTGSPLEPFTRFSAPAGSPAKSRSGIPLRTDAHDRLKFGVLPN
jgi:hypothetical protein